MYGVKTVVVTKIAKESYQKIKGCSKAEIFDLCEELWQSGYLEESFVACNWSYALHNHFEEQDFQVFKKWIDSYVNNWASCDTLCNHTVGAFLERFPEYVPELKEWAKSKNRWLRRAAAVSLIIPAKHGDFLGIILEIADVLLLDRDDLVQKGYGWMLKAASNKHQDEVFEYIMNKKAIMPRTALRYAIEKIPKDLRIRAMAK